MNYYVFKVHLFSFILQFFLVIFSGVGQFFNQDSNNKGIGQGDIFIFKIINQNMVFMNLRGNIFFIRYDKIQKFFNSKFLSSSIFKVFLIKTFPNFSCSFIRTVNIKQCITKCAENDVYKFCWLFLSFAILFLFLVQDQLQQRHNQLHQV